MGYQVILDIIGSSIIGGLLFLTLLNFTAQTMETKQTYRDEIVAQENLVNVVTVIEEDFRRMGYCTVRSNMTNPIVTMAAAESVRFKTDLPDPTKASGEGDGVVDSISYAFGAPVLATANPNDRMLLRRENTGPYGGSSMGVTVFHLTYLTSTGDSIPSPVPAARLNEINAVQVTISVENINPYSSVSGPDSLATVLVNWKQLTFQIKN